MRYDADGSPAVDGAYVFRYHVEKRLVVMRTRTNETCTGRDLLCGGGGALCFRYSPLARLYEVAHSVLASRFCIIGDAIVP